jgi:hypothetical protein
VTLMLMSHTEDEFASTIGVNLAGFFRRPNWRSVAPLSLSRAVIDRPEAPPFEGSRRVSGSLRPKGRG